MPPPSKPRQNIPTRFFSDELSEVANGALSYLDATPSGSKQFSSQWLHRHEEKEKVKEKEKAKLAGRRKSSDIPNTLFISSDEEDKEEDTPPLKVYTKLVGSHASTSLVPTGKPIRPIEREIIASLAQKGSQVAASQV